MIQPMILSAGFRRGEMVYDLWLPQCAAYIVVQSTGVKVLKYGRWLSVKRLVEDLLTIGRRS